MPNTFKLTYPLAKKLAARYRTPLYVYSADIIDDRIKTLKRAFRKTNPLICYALKANSNHSVCTLIAKRSLGADIVSGGELFRAIRAGFKPAEIIFSGVGKTEDELRAGLRAGVMSFNVESEEELEQLRLVAGRMKRQAPLSLRINPAVDVNTHPHIATGRAENKFGINPDAALKLYQRASKIKQLKIVGIQYHIGSQINKLQPFRKAAQSVLTLVSTLANKGIHLSFVDIGGGIGINYHNETPLSIQDYAQTIESIYSPWPHLKLIIEPGRYLVADAGVLLTRVLYTKKTAHREFIIIDAAMNDLPRPSLYDAWHPIDIVKPRQGRKTVVDVVGPICESGDVLARDRPLPPLKKDDLLCIQKAGAYGFSMSSQYNSRPRAAEVLVQGKNVHLARRRESIEDIIALESKSL